MPARMNLSFRPIGRTIITERAKVDGCRASGAVCGMAPGDSGGMGQFSHGHTLTAVAHFDPRVHAASQLFTSALSGASIMSRRPRQFALIAGRIGRRRETRHSVAPRKHALSIHRLIRHRSLRGGVLSAYRLGHGCSIVTDAGAGLCACRGAREKRKQCCCRAGIMLL